MFQEITGNSLINTEAYNSCFCNAQCLASCIMVCGGEDPRIVYQVPDFAEISAIIEAGG